MHNRARLLTASFLTKDLYLDWRLGAAPLRRAARRRRSGEQQRQLAVGRGDGRRHAAEPRRSTRSRQAKRFDPAGDYVRRYVPELAGIDGAAVHEPWKLARPPRGYPAPIVDHGEAVARLRRLTAYSGA